MIQRKKDFHAQSIFVFQKSLTQQYFTYGKYNNDNAII